MTVAKALVTMNKRLQSAYLEKSLREALLQAYQDLHSLELKYPIKFTSSPISNDAYDGMCKDIQESLTTFLSKYGLNILLNQYVMMVKKSLHALDLIRQRRSQVLAKPRAGQCVQNICLNEHPLIFDTDSLGVCDGFMRSWLMQREGRETETTVSLILERQMDRWFGRSSWELFKQCYYACQHMIERKIYLATSTVDRFIEQQMPKFDSIPENGCAMILLTRSVNQKHVMGVKKLQGGGVELVDSNSLCLQFSDLQTGLTYLHNLLTIYGSNQRNYYALDVIELTVNQPRMSLKKFMASS